MNFKNILIYFLIFFLIISSYFAYNNELKLRSFQDKTIQKIEKLKLQIKEFDHSSDEAIRLMAEMEIKKINCEAKNEELIKNLTNIKKNLKQTTKIKNNIRENFINLKKNASKIILDIEKYKNELDNSMKWFKYNSFLNSKEQSTKSYLRNKCLLLNNNICTIKLGCFHLINSEYLNLKYKFDIDSIGKEDQLISLDKFIKNKGGDCEDYSLFFKAEINYLKEKCNNIEFESWNNSRNSKKYWLDRNKEWYLENAEGITLKKEYINPVIICGQIKNSNKELSGHCILAFTKEKIEKIEDLKFIKHSPAIEPQDGHYIGIIEEDSGIYLKEKYNDILTSYISLIITDNDLYYLSNSEKKWVSYFYYYNKLNKQEKNLAIYTE